ncbi:hypothetical protein I4U23_015125 [Adineta vaga]|nr:hypothetical protein I4U23_015125 [Adineta vaga]
MPVILSRETVEILNIIIFVQRTFRTNSCAIYFFAASCAQLIFIYFTIFLNGLLIGYNKDPAQTSLVFCKFKLYLSSVTLILAPSFIILACIDRLIISSSSVKRRGWSQPRFAYRLVAGASVFCLISSIHAIIGATIYSMPSYSFCYVTQGPYMIFLTFYSTIIYYLLPPILMIILGLLTIINHSYVRRKDLHLLRMLLLQILVCTIFTIPATAFQIYQVTIDNQFKDDIQNARDLFFLSIALALFCIPHCISFYMYTITASIFRQEFKQIVLKCYQRLFPKRTNLRQIMIATHTN